MPQAIYLVDAFAHAPFTGNPAAVCPLQEEPSAEWMQSVAKEMNQAETAFFWPLAPGEYGLRWFTPAVEVDLCGHATLASAHVLFSQPPNLRTTEPPNQVQFHTKSGVLTCSLCGAGVPPAQAAISMDFPAEPPAQTPDPGAARALGVQPVWTGANRMDWFFVLESAEQLLSLRPDMAAVQALGKRGLIVTSPPNPRTPEPPNLSPDFLSRFFAPQSGIAEDPVTGSAHCALGPYWAERLGKSVLLAYQASPRGGYVTVSPLPSGGEGNRIQRVALTGQARTVLVGELRG